MSSQASKSEEKPPNRFRRIGWLIIGWAALSFGVIGVVLPLLPTTPFVLAAAFAFSKSSPKLRRWLVEHRTFGPMIADWERHGAIARRYKVLACSAMACALIGSFIAGVSRPILILQLIIMAIAATFVLTRPSTIDSDK